jgi:hypothetical protein
VKDKQIPRRRGRDQRKQIIKSAAPPQPINNKPFTWSAVEIDHEYVGEWDWNLTPKEVADLLKLLEQMSRLTWQQVKDQRTHSKRSSRPLHHDQPIDSICPAAQQRLTELQIDTETLFRLRHGNLIRVWGYLIESDFRILWYDRAHKICPSDK